MATATTTPVPDSARPSPEPSLGDQLVTWSGIGWKGYLALLKVQGEKGRPQINYLGSDARLLSTTLQHELLTDRVHQFVWNVAVGFDIDFVSVGETTLKCRKKRAGAQPDKSYYFGNWATIAAKVRDTELDLRVDPPPDLSIKVSDRQDTTVAVEALRRLGIPEVWVCRRKNLRILLRQPNGRYAESEAGLVFPFLRADEIHEWVTRPAMSSTTEWIRELRRWIEGVLIPRVRGQGG
jgi:Uma2 family endonuclease